MQEGLVNVRKHSGARHALVRLGSNAERWNLTIEDDGKGFPFAGSLTTTQMEETGKGPMIIKERVRLIARGTHGRIKSRTRIAPGNHSASGRGSAS